MIYIQALLSNYYLLVFIAIIITFLVANRIYPPLIWTILHKHLLDEPDDRSMHNNTTPTMGGVGIYISFIFTLTILACLIKFEYNDLIKLLALMGATMILLFLGVKDDLAAVNPKKKLMGQFVAATIVVLLADIRVVSFNGLFWLWELPYFVSVPLSIVVFVSLINAFNLIDGVDGLAGAIALVVSVAFGVFFFLNESILYLMVSCVLIGAILGFLRYNLSDSKKIFMGDTGSMFVGFLLCFQGLAFLELNALETTQFSVSNGPVMALAVLSYPILDTLRVFVIRIRNGRSPFSADRNHIHHRCLGLNLSHKQTTVLLTILNVLVIEFAFLTNELYINFHFFLALIFVPVVYGLPFIHKLEWLPSIFRIQKEDKLSKIVEKSKVENQLILEKIPNTYLESIPDSSTEYTVQRKKEVTDNARIESADLNGSKKISAKRAAALQKANLQNKEKRSAG